MPVFCCNISFQLITRRAKIHALEMVHFLEEMTLQFIYVYSETCENTSDGLYIWSYDSDNLLASQRA